MKNIFTKLALNFFLAGLFSSSVFAAGKRTGIAFWYYLKSEWHRSEWFYGWNRRSGCDDYGSQA